MSPSQWPKVVHGAFMEFGVSPPKVLVKFQFNPEELSRSRSLSFQPPGGKRRRRKAQSLREFHQLQNDLHVVRKKQDVTIEEESISFDIRLDATEWLGWGDDIAIEYGIAPELATLELLALPQKRTKKEDDSDERGISFSKTARLPLVLFVWGRRKVLPVNVNSLSIKETEFSPDLNPVRAVVSIKLTVIEGPNPGYMTTWSKALAGAREALPEYELDEMDVPS